MKLKIFRILIVSFFILAGYIVFADVPVIELQTELITEIEVDHSIIKYWGTENKVFINNMRMNEIDLESNEQRIIDKNNEFNYIRGEYDNDLVFSRGGKLYRYNTIENSYLIINNVDTKEIANKINNYFFDAIFHYYDEKYFISFKLNEGGIYISYLYDAIKDELKPLFDKEIVDISPDKQCLIINNRKNQFSSEIEIYYIGTGLLEKTGIVATLFKNQPSAAFIDNNYFITENRNPYNIYSLDGKLSSILKYMPPNKSDTNSYTILNIIDSPYAIFFDIKNKKNFIARSKKETEVMDELNLLFHQTTATLNDDRVRMREWPLLDAQHVAFLEKDEEVEVLDRSGIKVQIDDMNDYWYKVKRVDGQIGWTYGYFLDLAEKE